MRQAGFFDEPVTALQVWRVALPCCFGCLTLWGSVRAVGWFGQDHCAFCHLYQGEKR